MDALNKDELRRELHDLACRLEPTEPERGWLTEWLEKYTQTLSEWNLIEFASEKLRWQIGDLIIQLENRYGEAAHTVIEMLHEILNQQLDIRITLNLLYRCARIARIFPKQYRFRQVPYSVYMIIGEIDVGTTDVSERNQRRRLLAEAYAKLRQEQAVPVDYHAVRQFCDTYLQELLPAGAFKKRLPPQDPRFLPPSAPSSDTKVLILDDSFPARVVRNDEAEPVVPATPAVPAQAEHGSVLMPVIVEPPRVVNAEIVSEEPAVSRAESEPDTGVLVSLEAVGVQLRLELRCAPNRQGLIALVEQFVHTLRQHGYAEVFYDTWKYAERTGSVPGAEPSHYEPTR